MEDSVGKRSYGYFLGTGAGSLPYLGKAEGVPHTTGLSVSTHKVVHRHPHGRAAAAGGGHGGHEGGGAAQSAGESKHAHL